MKKPTDCNGANWGKSVHIVRPKTPNFISSAWFGHSYGNMRYTVYYGERPKYAQKLNQVGTNDCEGIHFHEVKLLFAEQGEGMGAQRSDKLAGLIQSPNTVLRA